MRKSRQVSITLVPLEFSDPAQQGASYAFAKSVFNRKYSLDIVVAILWRAMSEAVETYPTPSPFVTSVMRRPCWCSELN
jgi:hypothetical protein